MGHAARLLNSLTAQLPTKVVKEIKAEFREGALLRDEHEIVEAVARAEKGLEQLKQFTSIDLDSDDWSFTTEETPMPQPAADQTLPGQ